MKTLQELWHWKQFCSLQKNKLITVIVSNWLSCLSIYFSLLKSRIFSAGTIVSSVRTRTNEVEHKQTALHSRRQTGAAGQSQGWLSLGGSGSGTAAGHRSDHRAILWQGTRTLLSCNWQNQSSERGEQKILYPPSCMLQIANTVQCDFLNDGFHFLDSKEIAKFVCVPGSPLLSITVSTLTLL